MKQNHFSIRKQKVKTKKTYHGRVDRVSGEIIPKAEPGKRNRSISTRQREQISTESKLQIDELSKEVEALQERVSALTAQLEIRDKFIQSILSATSDYLDVDQKP